MADAMSFDELWDLLEPHGLASAAGAALVEGVVIPMLPKLHVDDLLDLDALCMDEPAARAATSLQEALEHENRRRSGPPPRSRREAFT